jgi:hypothetical protein
MVILLRKPSAPSRGRGGAHLARRRLAFAHGPHGAAGDVAQQVDRPVRPAHLHELGGAGGAEAEVQPQVVVRVVTRLAQDGPRLPAPARGDHDRRAERRAVGRRALEPQRKPAVASGVLVAQQRRGLVHVHDEDVEVAVVVVVAEGDPAARSRGDRARPAARGDVLESAVAEVAEHDLGPAVRVLGEPRLDLGVDVAGGVQEVRPAVVVQVGGTRPPLHVAVLDADSRGHRHVLEEPAPEVAV